MATRRPLIINASAQQIQELNDSDSLIGNGTIPVGGIIMWSGTIAAIPSGWALCNGSNGTPDLRNTFVIGAHSDSSGAKTTVTGSATQSGGDKDAVLIAHKHDIEVLTDAGGGSPNGTVDQNPTAGRATQQSPNSISLTGIDASGSASTTQTGTNANLPPYFALAYIMRTV
tara:strand:+ start:268 stop:780 length:513 start_codon:yes stop_codon:yes gene_type:complete